MMQNYKLQNIADGISEWASLAKSLKIISCIDQGAYYSTKCLEQLARKHGIKLIVKN